jgi:F0F1-type ATP synthase membrane subunit b/b'
MQAIAMAHREDFDAALEAARSVGKGGEVVGLAAPLGAALRGRLSDAWDHIESALQRAWSRGGEIAREAAEAATVKVQEIVDAAGAEARALHEAILAKLYSYLSELIDRALARVRGSVMVADQNLTLEGVELAQTITLTGALKASIQEVISFTAQGQIVVTARYAATLK